MISPTVAVARVARELGCDVPAPLGTLGGMTIVPAPVPLRLPESAGLTTRALRSDDAAHGPHRRL